MGNGFVTPVSRTSIDLSWVTFIRPSTDILEQNCELCAHQDLHSFQSKEASLSQMRTFLRVTRNLKHGEELKLWFSAPLAMLLGVPVLPPSCIHNPERYVCMECGTPFSHPNPLKVHIMLACVQAKSKNDASLLMHRRITFPAFGVERKNEKSAFKTLPVTMKTWNPIETDPVKTIPNTTAKGSNATSNEASKLKLEPEESKVSFAETVRDNPLKTPGFIGHACHFCGKVYSRRYGLKIHVRTHTGYKPLRCKYCCRPFSDPSNLNKHTRLHSELDTPYKCSLCGKVLVRRRDLERHLRARHPPGNSGTS